MSQSQEYQLPFQEINPNPAQRMQEISKEPSPIILLLDGMEDAKNLGAIFRIADACRITQIFMYKPSIGTDPIKLEKVSRQTTEHISYTELNTIGEVKELVKDYYPIALEYTNRSVQFNEFEGTKPCMLIVGNERRGVSEELLEISKISLHIPMLGQNSSMNVSVATGIVLYHLLENFGKI